MSISQADRERQKRRLTDEAQAARDEVEELTGHAPAAKKMALTTPIDKYMKKKTAPQLYQKTGPLQRRIDLEVMTFVATANVPFSVIDQKPFRRCDSSAFANLIDLFDCILDFGACFWKLDLLEHSFPSMYPEFPRKIPILLTYTSNYPDFTLVPLDLSRFFCWNRGVSRCTHSLLYFKFTFSIYRLVSALNPRAQIKNRTTYSRNTLVILYKNLHDALKNVLKHELADIKQVSFTTDLWSSAGSDDYSSLTMHYIAPSWEMRRFVIGCKDFEGQHTGASIARQLDQMIKDIPYLDLEQVAVTMTTDSASNMIKAFTGTSSESRTVDKHFKCIDHALNNCLKDALEHPELSPAVKLCKKLADAVHRSNLKWKAIEDKSGELGGEN